MKELVFKGENNQALTNSLLVAEKFGKEHKHVLDSIREAIKGCAENSADPMFVESTYINSQNGQQYPMYIMNEDGFTLIAMGFTGKKAFRFKLDYIAAFRNMKNKLKEQQKPLSAVQMFALQANISLEHEQCHSDEDRKQEVTLNGIKTGTFVMKYIRFYFISSYLCHIRVKLPGTNIDHVCIINAN